MSRSNLISSLSVGNREDGSTGGRGQKCSLIIGGPSTPVLLSAAVYFGFEPTLHHILYRHRPLYNLFLLLHFPESLNFPLSMSASPQGIASLP
jgi:hypothetical protein